MIRPDCSGIPVKIMRKLYVSKEIWPVAGVFRISRGSRTETEVVVVRIEEDGIFGFGESAPYGRYRETVSGVIKEIELLGEAISKGLTREELWKKIPAGAARNAVDCALWDLEAKKSGMRVWELAGLPAPDPATTAITISVDQPEAMAESARAHTAAPLVKVKLGGEGDLERMKAVRRVLPKAELIVDANEAWTPEMCRQLLPEMAALDVKLIEQPLPAGEDEILREIDRIVPICADESCHVSADLPKLRGKYDFVNIKLDKTGGLTEALHLAREAEKAGFGIMVGCMLGTSLAMAPAVLLASKARFVDLDGAILLAKDRDHPLSYVGGKVHPPDVRLWG